jgi:DNA invertase Pin-like site-specific DNA recombinase
MKAAIYVRVSRADQNTTNQELALREYCDRAKLDVFNVYKDEGVSGMKTERDALDQMLRDMREGKFDTIVVWKLDRLGRSLQHLLLLLEEFQTLKVRLVITTMGVDTETAMGRFFCQVCGAFAEFEREIIIERTNAGLARARAEGKVLGRPKGAKDSRKRRRSGYWQRWAGK